MIYHLFILNRIMVIGIFMMTNAGVIKVRFVATTFILQHKTGLTYFVTSERGGVRKGKKYNIK